MSKHCPGAFPILLAPLPIKRSVLQGEKETKMSEGALLAQQKEPKIHRNPLILQAVRVRVHGS